MTEIIATEERNWDIVIKPKTSLFDLNLKDIWHYRDLLILFVKRDFAAQYKQTILGPVWHLIQPVFTTIMFLIIFGKIANIPITGGIHPIVFYMSGITLWNYFSACLVSTSNTFVANANIFGKVYFPRLIIPLSIVFSNMIRFGIQFLLLLSVMIFVTFQGYTFTINVLWLLIPFLLLLMAALGLGSGIIISSLTTKYRDLAVLVTFGVQLMMYITPIAYPLAFLQGKSYAWLIKLNPLSGITEAFRYILFMKGELDVSSLSYSVVFTVVVFFAGLTLFNRVEKTFMDTV